jgi:hypothetical protein
MNDQLSALFPWLGTRSISYNSSNDLKTQLQEEGKRIGDPITYGFGFNVDNKDYVFVPASTIEKGFQRNGYQLYMPDVLRPEFAEQLKSGIPYTVSDLAKAGTSTDFLDKYQKQDFTDERGFLIPKEVFSSVPNQIVQSYKLGFVGPEGVSTGPIQGLSAVNGKPVYVTGASGRQNAQSYVYYDPNQKKNYSGVIQQQWYEPGEKWYDTTLGKIGIALIVGGTAGLALGGTAAAGTGAAAGGTAAAGGAAGGTGLTVGAAGTTGLTAGAAGTTGLVAPAGFTFAPGVGAAVGAGTTAAVGAGTGGSTSAGGTGLLDTAQFGQTGQTGLTPGAAGQGLQVPTTPGLSSMGGGTGLAVPVSGGTVTQLGFVPTGATPVLGDPASFINNPDVLGNTVFSTDYLAVPGAATGLSVTDALRIANQARGLLGAGQNPIVPQQQGLPQSAAGSQGVDYSGLLSLLQLQAGTPNVAGYTAPAQLRQIYQPTLLPNVLSLLG